MEHLSDELVELVEFWTLLDEDRALLEGRRGATALGFALLLKHNSRHAHEGLWAAADTLVKAGPGRPAAGHGVRDQIADAGLDGCVYSGRDRADSQ